MYGLGSGGRSRELEGFPASRDDEGSPNETYVPLYARVWIGSGIDTLSGEVDWNCCGDAQMGGYIKTEKRVP